MKNSFDYLYFTYIFNNMFLLMIIVFINNIKVIVEFIINKKDIKIYKTKNIKEIL